MTDFPPDQSATHSNIEAEAAQAAAHRDDHELDINGLRASSGMQKLPEFTPRRLTVDIGGLSKAQHDFIRAQTDFLMQMHAYGSKEYTDAVMVYSRAQTELIWAQGEALKQAGVI